MFNLVGKVASVIFLVAVIAAGVVVGVSLLRSEDDSGRVDTFRYVLADRVASEAADTIRESTEAEKICVLPVGRDEFKVMSDLLEEKIRNLGYYRLVKAGKVLEAIEEVMEGKEMGSLGIPEALDIGKKVGAEAVVFASLDSFLPPKRDDPAEIDFDLSVLDVKEAKVVTKQSFSDKMDKKFSMAYFSAAMHESSGWIRLLIWVVLVGLAPFATQFIVKGVTKKENNAGNLAMLSGYTFFDLFVALFLLGFLVKGFWLGLLIFIGFLAAGAYNYIACTIIYEMGK